MILVRDMEGTYRHYKGGYYGIHGEVELNGELHVLYKTLKYFYEDDIREDQRLQPTEKYWLRPKTEFKSTVVDKKGNKVPRFKRISGRTWKFPQELQATHTETEEVHEIYVD